MNHTLEFEEDKRSVMYVQRRTEEAWKSVWAVFILLEDVLVFR